MQVSDIVVGKKYRSIEDVNHSRVMLGVGMRVIGTDNEFTDKHLVIIENGMMIQEGKNVVEGFWDRIVELDCGLYAF